MEDSIVRTAQFDTILSKPPAIILKMRASTRSPKSVPGANPHIETLIIGLKMILNPVVLVRACHMPRIKHTYRYTKDTSPKNHKEQF